MIRRSQCVEDVDILPLQRMVAHPTKRFEIFSDGTIVPYSCKDNKIQFGRQDSIGRLRILKRRVMVLTFEEINVFVRVVKKKRQWFVKFAVKDQQWCIILYVYPKNRSELYHLFPYENIEAFRCYDKYRGIGTWGLRFVDAMNRLLRVKETRVFDASSKTFLCHATQNTISVELALLFVLATGMTFYELKGGYSIRRRGWETSCVNKKTKKIQRIYAMSVNELQVITETRKNLQTMPMFDLFGTTLDKNPVCQTYDDVHSVTVRQFFNDCLTKLFSGDNTTYVFDQIYTLLDAADDELKLRGWKVWNVHSDVMYKRYLKLK